MKEMYQRLLYKTKANDLDEAKGIVTVAVNGIGIVDSQNDISMPGSFNKTLKENIGRMKWFLNHDTTQLLGVPLEGEERDGNLVMTGQLNLAKQIGRDTLEDYKLYASAGRTLEHSIGVQAIKRDPEDKRKVLEWKMWEYSTLTSWGSNPQTFLVGIKNDNPSDVRANIEFIRNALKMRYSDERLKQYEMRLDMLNKALEGAVVVTCPYCGEEFVWDEAERHTFDQQVLDAAGSYLSWLADGIVREEMNKLKPEIRAAVLAILSPVLSKCDGKIDAKLVQKSLTDLTEYAYCPHCYARVYSSSITLGQETPAAEKTEDEPSEDTRDEDEEQEKKAATGTFFGSLNAAIEKH
ncbi:HK97 family phage prohead protease [Sodaliphilus pleomorphus]|uniref:Phage prohead protein n=1 Tax=Sodaliphilus pleomorphus TaxID=2606626 RepID=A0A6L5X7G0_9BACT|nr:phage prohead protein [Sodaliphilus pleomorphus]MSS16200.1 phage prohead protein [Sodaliphilus pleomorphus]